jgi:hypothetical protein
MMESFVTCGIAFSMVREFEELWFRMIAFLSSLLICIFARMSPVPRCRCLQAYVVVDHGSCSCNLGYVNRYTRSSCPATCLAVTSYNMHLSEEEYLEIVSLKRAVSSFSMHINQ